MDREAYELWAFDNRELEGVLRAVEKQQRSILKAMNCPTDVVRIYRILNEEDEAPWPKRTAERDRLRAKFAMHALIQVAQTRQNLVIGNERAQRAAHAAVLAGLHANSANAILAQAARLKAAHAPKRKTKRRTVQRHARLRREAAKLSANLTHKAKAERLARTFPLSAERIRRILAGK